MVIDGVKEKFEEQKEIGFYQNNSSFILCDYELNNDKYRLINITPLENKMFNILIDRNMLLTDTSGNILLELNSAYDNNKAIEYVNNNNIIISNYIKIRPNFVVKRKYKSIDHYYYDKKLNFVNNLYNEKDGKLANFEFPNYNYETLLIETETLFDKSARLYSISEKKDISPRFKSLDTIEKTHDKIFKFTDKISSSLIINNIRYSSNIIGFITIDGIFYNGVFDELTNKEIECELNSKKDCFNSNFVEYEELKEMIQNKLNEKVIKESNKQSMKGFILKKIENKAKNIIK